MKAVLYERYGAPQELVVREIAEPRPRPAEVKVRVHAASVNPVDWKVLRGDLKLVSGWRMPRRLGADFAGVVAERGSSVTRLNPGDAVLGSINPLSGRQGSFAEFICVSEEQLALQPKGLSHAEAACLPISGVSAIDCLRRLGRARPGQRVLIIGATGGVGSFCVQLATLWGLTVTAVCRAEHSTLALELGARSTVSYDAEDPLKVDGTFHLILDVAAKYSYGRCAHLLTPHGTYVNTMPGAQTIFDTVRTRLLGRRRRACVLMAKMDRSVIEEIAGLTASKQVRVVIDHTYPLEHVRHACARSMTGHVRGKIVVAIATR